MALMYKMNKNQKQLQRKRRKLFNRKRLCRQCKVLLRYYHTLSLARQISDNTGRIFLRKEQMRVKSKILFLESCNNEI